MSAEIVGLRVASISNCFSTIMPEFGWNYFKTIIQCLKQQLNQLIDQQDDQSLPDPCFPPNNSTDVVQGELNFNSFIELNPFQGDEQLLLTKLQTCDVQPEDVFQEILYWTNGQLFLTHFLLNLVANDLNFEGKYEIKSKIEQLVKNQILQDQGQIPLRTHFQQITHYFIRADPEQVEEKLYALNLYHQIRFNSEPVEFDQKSTVQKGLISLGLVTTFNNILGVANPIYEQTFAEDWIQITHQLVLKRSIQMPSNKIYNRQVYMLIDQSGSMVDRDPFFNDQRRWKAMPETLKGHVYGILEQQGMDDERICDEITLTFFSQPYANTMIRNIQDPAQIEPIFREVSPDTTSFLVPTLNRVIENWFGTRSPDQNGFIIIYTDGELDDKQQFVNLIKQTCARLNSQDELKIIIIGIGSDINRNPRPWLELDRNSRGFSDRNALPCNIVVFDLLNKMPSIIQLLDRQLENALAGLAEWGREVCPDLY